MREYNITVSSPDGNIFCGNVVAVYARGIEGDLAILAGHAPFVTFFKAL